MSVDAEVGSALCANCGLCCDGSLFSRAKATKAEQASLSANGLTTEEADGKLYFRLGCSRLSGTRCTIYPDRFSICRSFRCKLLGRLLNGEVRLEEARAVVSTARTMLDQAAEAAPEARRYAGRREIMKGYAGWNQRPDRDEVAGRVLKLLALERFLARNFRKD